MVRVKRASAVYWNGKRFQLMIDVRSRAIVTNRLSDGQEIYINCRLPALVQLLRFTETWFRNSEGKRVDSLGRCKRTFYKQSLGAPKCDVLGVQSCLTLAVRRFGNFSTFLWTDRQRTMEYLLLQLRAYYCNTYHWLFSDIIYFIVSI